MKTNHFAHRSRVVVLKGVLGHLHVFNMHSIKDFVFGPIDIILTTNNDNKLTTYFVSHSLKKTVQRIKFFAATDGPCWPGYFFSMVLTPKKQNFDFYAAL